MYSCNKANSIVEKNNNNFLTIFNKKIQKKTLYNLIYLNNEYNSLETNLSDEFLDKMHYLLKLNYTQLIGYKQIGNEILLASDCVLDNNFNIYNYNNYFCHANVYVSAPIIENVLDLICLNNNNNSNIVKTTNKSHIFKFKI